MPKKTPKHLLAAASNARAARKEKLSISYQLELDENQDPSHSNSVQRPQSPDESDASDDSERECGYEGGVDNFISSDDEFVPGLRWELEDGKEWDSDEELSEYDEEMMEQLKREAIELVKPTPFEEISSTAVKNWQKIEANRSLGYNGQSRRTQERRAQQERLKRSTREEAKTS
jgi:hypothetical protein